MSLFRKKSVQKSPDVIKEKEKMYDSYLSFKDTFNALVQNSNGFSDLINVCDNQFLFVYDNTYHDMLYRGGRFIHSDFEKLKSFEGEVNIECEYDSYFFKLTGMCTKGIVLENFSLHDTFYSLKEMQDRSYMKVSHSFEKTAIEIHKSTMNRHESLESMIQRAEEKRTAQEKSYNVVRMQDFKNRTR